MKILFSPSESKKHMHNDASLSPKISLIYDQYLSFVNQATLQELQKIWGYKNIDEIEKMRLLSAIPSVYPAIECYSGVAYEALDFVTLQDDEKDFLLDSVLIFSNLFGAVSAREKLPFYKLKQGEGFGEFQTKQLYSSLQDELDIILSEECVVDLRAEFYQKLYPIPSHFFSFEFLKNHKKVSHYAKYYRGIVLREIAKNQGINRIEQRMLDWGLKFLGCEEDQKQTKFIFTL